MKILVCGGRDFADRELLITTLDELDTRRPIACVIHGAAKGADSLGGEWGELRGKEVQAFPADWATQGRKAGPKRNQRMLDEGRPDLVVAFPGGHGTADMMRRARAAGVEVIEVSQAHTGQLDRLLEGDSRILA